MNVGDTVYFLVNYKIYAGKVLKINKKTVEVDIPAQNWHIAHTKKVSKDKIMEANEMAIPVWEQWKGVNGRGGYRIDRTMYPQKHKPGRNWYGAASWDYAWESAYGVLSR